MVALPPSFLAVSQDGRTPAATLRAGVGKVDYRRETYMVCDGSLAKVRDVMQTNVERVEASTSVLEAAKLMNDVGSSGVVVFNGDKAVGMVTDRRLLRRFLPLNRKPEDVEVKEVMSPFFKIEADASTKEAKRRLIEAGITRLGVFDGDKFLGWVMLSDLEGKPKVGRTPLLNAILHDDKAEPVEVLCPNCRSGFMEKLGTGGEVIRYQCPNCGYSL
jgi:CBS domain-containing protein/ribosomal protein S27AE